MKRFVAAVSLLALSPDALANDSSAAIGLGGLELTQSDAISMDSEELLLSRERVTVKYRFTNTSSKDVETLVSFPLPAIPAGVDGHMGDQGFPDWTTDLEFKTLVDGQPVKLEMRDIVSIMGDSKNRDVSAALNKLGWPIRYWSDYKFQQKLQELSATEKAAGVVKGLLRSDERGAYIMPNWQVATHVTRTQIFPAGKTVMVEHSYKPVMGGSVGGGLLKKYRKDSSDYLKAHCVDKSFLRGFDARIAAQERASKKEGKEYGNIYGEEWLSYVLKSGTNWKGPIKDFRLVVDKGAAGNMVSFCMDGVKKINATQFEVRKTNFEPSHNLNILIVRFADPSTW